MKKMMTYQEANQILGCSLTPANRCIDKTTAIANGAAAASLAAFEYNRLIPVDSASISKYTITFVDYDGSTIAVLQFDPGSIIVPPANPSRSGYTFDGWKNTATDQMLTANTIADSNKTYIATYSIAGTYNIIFRGQKHYQEGPAYYMSDGSIVKYNDLADSDANNVVGIYIADYQTTFVLDLVNGQKIQFGASTVSIQDMIDNYSSNSLNADELADLWIDLGTNAQDAATAEEYCRTRFDGDGSVMRFYDYNSIITKYLEDGYTQSGNIPFIGINNHLSRLINLKQLGLFNKDVEPFVSFDENFPEITTVSYYTDIPTTMLYDGKYFYDESTRKYYVVNSGSVEPAQLPVTFYWTSSTDHVNDENLSVALIPGSHVSSVDFVYLPRTAYGYARAIKLLSLSGLSQDDYLLYQWLIYSEQTVLAGAVPQAPMDQVNTYVNPSEGKSFNGWHSYMKNSLYLTPYPADCDDIYEVVWGDNRELYWATFMNYDGTVHYRHQFEAGTTPSDPTTPVKDGATFVRWNPTLGPIFKDTIYYPVYDDQGSVDPGQDVPTTPSEDNPVTGVYCLYDAAATSDRSDKDEWVVEGTSVPKPINDTGVCISMVCPNREISYETYYNLADLNSKDKTKIYFKYTYVGKSTSKITNIRGTDINIRQNIFLSRSYVDEETVSFKFTYAVYYDGGWHEFTPTWPII